MVHSPLDSRAVREFFVLKGGEKMRNNLHEIVEKGSEGNLLRIRVAHESQYYVGKRKNISTGTVNFFEALQPEATLEQTRQGSARTDTSNEII